MYSYLVGEFKLKSSSKMKCTEILEKKCIKTNSIHPLTFACPGFV